MRCRDFEVAVAPDDALALQGYVAGFYSTPPPPGILALEGVLVSDECDTVVAIASYASVFARVQNLDFAVTGAIGPWLQHAGAEPKLRRLRLLRNDAALPKQQQFECSGLELELDVESSHEHALPGAQPPSVALSMDTALAYHWMRFGSYLEWARYIVTAIRQESPPEGAYVVDVGGGSGWMSTLLKAHLGHRCEVLCTDIAPEALELAHANFRRNDLQVAVAQGDLFEPVHRRAPPWPNFAVFYPPQDPSAQSAPDGAAAWRGSPDVALAAPAGEGTHFHARFCREARLAPGGVAWLCVDWELLPAVVEICCTAGWSVTLPPAIRDLMHTPSALVELRQRQEAPGLGDDECVSAAMLQVEGAAEYLTRAIGAGDAAARTEMFREAAERGLRHGLVNFGAALALGAGVPKDEGAAAQWFLRAADAGEVGGLVNLGRMLAGGAVNQAAVPRDDVAAAALYRRAALQGHEQAQGRLVALYVEGRVDPAGHADAAVWARKVAERGDADAQTLLAKMYLKGEGVGQSHVEAARWLRVAAKARTGPEAEALMQAVAHLEAAGDS